MLPASGVDDPVAAPARLAVEAAGRVRSVGVVSSIVARLVVHGVDDAVAASLIGEAVGRASVSVFVIAVVAFLARIDRTVTAFGLTTIGRAQQTAVLALAGDDFEIAADQAGENRLRAARVDRRIQFGVSVRS